MNPNKLLLGTRETYEESLETWDNKALKALGTRICDIFNTHLWSIQTVNVLFTNMVQILTNWRRGDERQGMFYSTMETVVRCKLAEELIKSTGSTENT